MEDAKIRKSEEIEIDLSRLLRAVLNKAGLVAAVSAACALIVLLGSVFLVTPRYQSSVMFYINNSERTEDRDLSWDDISASRSLVQTCIVILDARSTLRDVIGQADAGRTCEQLRGMIDARAVDDTEILRVDVSAPDPQEAERIANAIACVLPERIAAIVEGASVKVVDTAVVASWPSSPGYLRNAVLGLLLGMVLTVVGIMLREVYNCAEGPLADEESEEDPEAAAL